MDVAPKSRASRIQKPEIGTPFASLDLQERMVFML
jgi:hypothetical protein